MMFGLGRYRNWLVNGLHMINCRKELMDLKSRRLPTGVIGLTKSGRHSSESLCQLSRIGLWAKHSLCARKGKAMNHEGWYCDRIGSVFNRRVSTHSCQCLQADLALAKESGDRKEKMLARRSKGRLLHMVAEKRVVFHQKLSKLYMCIAATTDDWNAIIQGELLNWYMCIEMCGHMNYELYGLTHMGISFFYLFLFLNQAFGCFLMHTLENFGP